MFESFSSKYLSKENTKSRNSHKEQNKGTTDLTIQQHTKEQK